MKDKIIKVISYIMVALISAGTAILIYMTVDKSPSTALTGSTKLAELNQIIDNYFIGDHDQAALDDAAAQAMVEALNDPWSYYIAANQYDDYQDMMNNVTVGIGITVEADQEGRGYVILSVTPNSPAQEVGLQAKDIIVAVEGTSIAGADLETVTGLVKGEENTDVILTIQRGDQELNVTVTRKYFQLPVATYKMLEGNIGLITIENFDARCADETIAAIEDLRAQGAVALIFDVRNNPGGYKDEMIRVLDYLLPEGLLFKAVNYAGQTSEDYSDASCVDLPMAVLVNGNSYSAAEFFAAALNDFGAAVVVGEQTFGKGYFQTTIQMSDGSAVNLSIGKYYTPKGISLAGVGLEPSIKVEVDDLTAYYIYYDALEPEEDPQIMAAVNALK